MVFGDLKITTDGRNIGPANLSFNRNKFSGTGGYLKDKLLIEGFH